MRPIESAINTESDEYKANHAAMVEHCDTLRERLAMATEQGKPAAIKKHLDRFQMLARERVELILDEGSPYLELMSLAGWEQDDMTLGGSSVIGIGLVEGVECLVSASVPTRAGGATNEVSVIKSLRAQEIARENRLPFINLVQSAGANLTQQSKVFNRGGASFRNIAQLSKLGVPSASIVFGNSTAGGAYIPGMSDFSVFVQRKAAVFLGGPPLVFAATGETTGEEELGGADMHARISGVADGMAIDEHHAIYLAREWVRGLSYTWERVDGWSYRHSVPNAWSIHRPPKFPADELLGIVSANPRVPYDAREVLLRIVDASELSEFKSLYGPNLVCAWAVIHGVAVGILTNNGVIFAPEARKAAQFIQLCNARGTPLVFFHNITGFMVGKAAEEDGIIKAGSLMINAVSNRQVPAISIFIGNSYGAGNYAMAGRSYAPNFLFAWPNSKCSVMGAEQLTNVMDIIARQAAEKSNRPVNEEKLGMQKAALQSIVDGESDAYFNTSRMQDDGLIDPRNTRTVLGITLQIVAPLVRPQRERTLVGVSRL